MVMLRRYLERRRVRRLMLALAVGSARPGRGRSRDPHGRRFPLV